MKEILFKTKTYSGKNLKVNILKNNYINEINILLHDFAEFEKNLKTMEIKQDKQDNKETIKMEQQEMQKPKQLSIEDMMIFCKRKGCNAKRSIEES